MHKKINTAFIQFIKFFFVLHLSLIWVCGGYSWHFVHAELSDQPNSYVHIAVACQHEASFDLNSCKQIKLKSCVVQSGACRVS